MIDPEFEMYLNETLTDARTEAEIERSTQALDKFFSELELQQALGDDRLAEVAPGTEGRGESRALRELRNFVKSEKRDVAQRGVSKAEVKASLAALRSILGRVIESA